MVHIPIMHCISARDKSDAEHDPNARCRYQEQALGTPSLSPDHQICYGSENVHNQAERIRTRSTALYAVLVSDLIAADTDRA